MPLVVDVSLFGRKTRKGKVVKRLTRQEIVDKYQDALVSQQEQVRREVPLADEKTLNLVITE